MKENRVFSVKNFFSSLSNALNGIRDSFRDEHNIKIQLTAAIIVVIFSLLFRISHYEWLAIIVSIALVLSLELINTAIERTVDLFCAGEYHELARYAKDAAAGAVLIASLSSLIVGLVIFLPRIWNILNNLL